MDILVTALYVAGTVSEGGSSLFMKCIADTLKAMGHKVTATNNPASVYRRKYDLIICSHNAILRQLIEHPAIKVCISHGTIAPERLTYGAHLYYSISEESRAFNFSNSGINSRVLPQPVSIPTSVPHVNACLKNILIIRRYPFPGKDPFDCLKAKYTVRVSDPSRPLEPQIEWADMCITLGRGALQAMSFGRLVLVADYRNYMGRAYGDGYLHEGNIQEIAINNFSGRRYRHEPTPAWLAAEVARYEPDDAIYLRRYVSERNNNYRVVAGILKDAEKILRVRKTVPDVTWA